MRPQEATAAEADSRAVCAQAAGDLHLCVDGSLREVYITGSLQEIYISAVTAICDTVSDMPSKAGQKISFYLNKKYIS